MLGLVIGGCRLRLRGGVGVITSFHETHDANSSTAQNQRNDSKYRDCPNSIIGHVGLPLLSVTLL